MLKENIITTKKIKIAAICFMIFSITIIIYVLATNLSHLGKIAVEIKYAPFEASVFIDGKNYPVNNAVNYLEPGPHHITVAMNGFRTLEEDIEVTEETKYLYGALEAVDANDVKLYKEYQNDYGVVEGIEGKQSDSEAQKIIEKWPILNYLPYVNEHYSLGSLFNEQGNLVLTVRTKPQWINNAIIKLRSLIGDEISQYNIEIRDFENVLEGKFIDNDSSDPIEFLQKGYQGISTPFQVNDGQQSGNYYYTTISVGRYAVYIPVNYRVVLKKNGASWQLIGNPYPVLTIYNTPDVDKDIINAANNLVAPAKV